jgi:hypothetical protein
MAASWFSQEGWAGSVPPGGRPAQVSSAPGLHPTDARRPYQHILSVADPKHLGTVPDLEVASGSSAVYGTVKLRVEGHHGRGPTPVGLQRLHQGPFAIGRTGRAAPGAVG